MIVFRRKHKHRFEHTNLGCGPAMTVRVATCDCGFESRELTPAGHQQVAWWTALGLSYPEAEAGVLANTLPYPMVNTPNGWVLVDTREMLPAPSDAHAEKAAEVSS